MPQSANAITRPAARLLVIDPADRLLLMRWTHAIVRSPTGSVWITPGGGVDGAETYEEAALRELREETGIETVPLGPCVWTREHTFEFERATLRQVERFYVVRITETALSRDGWTPGEHKHISDVRWWSADEVSASEDWFAPRNLGALLPPILAGEYPAPPVNAGV